MGRIDQKLTEQAEDEAKTYGEILRRLISVIVFISERGLAFRGENETFGSPKNGYYLGILELIAKYDHFLNDHIKKMETKEVATQTTYHRRFARR